MPVRIEGAGMAERDYLSRQFKKVHRWIREVTMLTDGRQENKEVTTKAKQ